MTANLCPVPIKRRERGIRGNEGLEGRVGGHIDTQRQITTNLFQIFVLVCVGMRIAINILHYLAVRYSVTQCVAVHCNALHCVAVRYSASM